jgi:MraZ protein
MNHWNGEHQDMLRRFVAGVEMQELDKSGRLLLTKRKLQAAGITDEVRFVGMDDRIEIWNPTRFDEYLNEGEDTLGADLQRCMADDPQSPPPVSLRGRDESEA